MAKKQAGMKSCPCPSPFNKMHAGRGKGGMVPDHGESKSYEKKEEKAMKKGGK
jgi:hypothetical protein